MIALLFRLVKPGVELSKLVMSRLVIRIQFSGLQQDFDCILKLAFGGVTFAELEIGQIHQKLDVFRDVQWAQLVATQQKQIEYLETIIKGPEEGRQGA